MNKTGLIAKISIKYVLPTCIWKYFWRISRYFAFFGNFAGFRGNTWISRVRDRAKYQKPCTTVTEITWTGYSTKTSLGTGRSIDASYELFCVLKDFYASGGEVGVYFKSKNCNRFWSKQKTGYKTIKSEDLHLSFQKPNQSETLVMCRTCKVQNHISLHTKY